VPRKTLPRHVEDEQALPERSSRRKKIAVEAEERSEYTQEQRFHLETLRIRERGKLIAIGLRCLAVVACFAFTGRAVEALAGKATIAEILVKLLANQGFSSTVAWLVGGAGAGIGLNERRLRRRDGKLMGERLKRYEKQLDPHRSSSRLDLLGDYREQD